jgi:hypothetical protein
MSMLLLQVVVPRPGSPLCFSAIEHFAVATFKDMAAYERSADVRQVRLSVFTKPQKPIKAHPTKVYIRR